MLLQRLATREKWIPTRQERAGSSALFFVGEDVPACTPSSPFLSGLRGDTAGHRLDSEIGGLYLLSTVL